MRLRCDTCHAEHLLAFSCKRRGDIGYSLKIPYRDGTTDVIFEPLDFIARLAALVLPPRLNLTRFHGVFAPNSPDRARITPARRGRGARPVKPAGGEHRTPAKQQASMRWTKRLKRVFQTDVEACPNCGGSEPLVPCPVNADKIGAAFRSDWLLQGRIGEIRPAGGSGKGQT